MAHIKDYPVLDRERLPNSGDRVVIFWLTEYGKQRTSMGFYAAKHTVSAEHWDDCEFADWNNDIPYCPEGWHEEMYESEYFYPITGEIVGWQQLPKFPECQNN